MRDPKRIMFIMKQFQSIWFSNPDLRFVQILDLVRVKMETISKKDVFFLEDDEVELYLEKIMMAPDKII